jgi:hypothetical protein
MTTVHYSPEAWADFARHVADADSRAAMQRHLDRGCRDCAELHATFRAIQTAAGADARFEPPAADLRLAKAMFAIRPPESPFVRAAATVKLLFDSQLMAAPIGLRNLPPGPRKFLFASGDMVIDLQVTPGRDAKTIELTGQITMPSHLDRRVSGVPALLHRGMQRVAKATTNQHGEFHLEFDGPADDLSLALGSDPDPTVISLGTLTRTQS